MGPPPGIGAPPGMDSAGSPTTMQSQFQRPPNMPNMDFTAPVIRMGVPGQDQQSKAGDRLTGGHQGSGRGSNQEPIGNRGRLGLGASGDGGGSRNIERDRAAVRESMMALQPPTREEVARTIFIGGLGEGAPNDQEIETLLRCAGKLRRWTRARDAEDRACKFGFAEYEDVESLEAANEIYTDFTVPVIKNGAVIKDEEGDEEGSLAGVKKMRLLVVVDEASKAYITEWTAKRKEDDNARQFRIDGCREDLRQCLAALANSGSYAANGMNGDRDGDVSMGNVNGGDEFAENAEVINIPLSLEDELSDIAPELRATVVEEIKAFRDRSNRRDLERMRREEEMEQAERQRNGGRVNRLASPPPSGAPSGPASSANGIPVGPRDRSGVVGAPAGPRGYRGVQMPSDYANGVTFVGANGTANGISLNREDEDSEASDDELERRRKQKRDAELEKQYADAERKWLNRERTRASAQAREKEREANEAQAKERDAEAMKRKYSSWDDDELASRGTELYYQDRARWVANRAAVRDREERADEYEREQEAKENADEQRRKAEAMGMADDFMDQMSSELEARTTAVGQTPAAGTGASGPGLKISLGSAAAKTKAAQAAAASQPPARRGMADVEGLLDDEEDAAAAGLKRPELKPLSDLSTAPTDPAEKAAARQALAAEIPTDIEALFAFPLKRQHLTSAIVDGQIRPFVEKQVVEFLGVQEDLLVDTVVDGLKEGKEARAIVSEVEGALEEEEAERLVKKVWRMVLFLTEQEARDLA